MKVPAIAGKRSQEPRRQRPGIPTISAPRHLSACSEQGSSPSPYTTIKINDMSVSETNRDQQTVYYRRRHRHGEPGNTRKLEEQVGTEGSD